MYDIPNVGEAVLVNDMLGKLEYIELNSPELEQKLRIRYHSEIDALVGDGFRWLCVCGEAFSVFRLLLVAPALIVLMMLFKREVVRLHGRSKLVMCYPVLVSSDKTTLATAFGLGVKFYTTFADGSGLVSATLGGRNLEVPGMTKRYYSAGIHEVWARHQESVLKFTGQGKQPDRQLNLRHYIEFSAKEDALSEPLLR